MSCCFVLSDDSIAYHIPFVFFFFQAEDGIRDVAVTGVQTCALPISMIAADEFDVDTMMAMFQELRAKQIRAEAEGRDGLSPEMRAFIEDAKAQGITRCPIRDIEAQMGKCPVDLKTMKPEEAKAAMERLLAEQAGD